MAIKQVLVLCNLANYYHLIHDFITLRLYINGWNIPWLIWWYECVSFLILPIKNFLVGYPAMLASWLMNSPPWNCLLLRLVYPIMILNIVSANIFFPFGKMIGMVRSRTSFTLSSQSWKMAVLLQAVQEGWTTWSIDISWGKILHLSVSTVNVFWQFDKLWWSAPVREDIFGQNKSSYVMSIIVSNCRYGLDKYITYLFL